MLKGRQTQRERERKRGRGREEEMERKKERKRVSGRLDVCPRLCFGNGRELPWSHCLKPHNPAVFCVCPPPILTGRCVLTITRPDRLISPCRYGTYM